MLLVLLVLALLLAPVGGTAEEGDGSIVSAAEENEVVSREAVMAEARKHFAAGEEQLLRDDIAAAAREYRRGWTILVSAERSNPQDHPLQEFRRHWEETLTRVSQATALDLLAELETESAEEPSGEANAVEPAEEEAETAVTAQGELLDHLPRLARFPAHVPSELRDLVSAKARSGRYQIPLMLAPGVLQAVHYFQTHPSGRKIIGYGLRHRGLYGELIGRILEDEGLPPELISLAQVESNFWPRAASPAGALGLWQFTAETATRYGLKRNVWLDERRDPEKSTRAAARHLKGLYERFGDWYLVLAAYNAGERRVETASDAGRTRDYWELCRQRLLPPETRRFVPLFLATMMILEDPKYFGFDAKPLSPPDQQEVMLLFSVDLAELAKAANIDVRFLYRLNPELTGYTTPEGGAAYRLKIPTGTASQIEEQLEALRLASSMVRRPKKAAERMPATRRRARILRP